MQRRSHAAALAAFSLLVVAGSVQAQTALDAIVAKKQINIAVPTDSPDRKSVV